MEGKNSSDESSEDDAESEESSDDEHTWTKEVKKQHRIIQREHRAKEREEEMEERAKQPKMYELRQGEEFKGVHNMKRKLNKCVLLLLSTDYNIQGLFLKFYNFVFFLGLRWVSDCWMKTPT